MVLEEPLSMAHQPMLKIPFDLVAAILGSAFAYYIYFHTGFIKQFKKVWEGK